MFNNSFEHFSINNSADDALKKTISSMRIQLEKKESQRMEEIQQLELKNQSVNKQLMGTISELRKKLEGKSGKKRK